MRQLKYIGVSKNPLFKQKVSPFKPDFLGTVDECYGVLKYSGENYLPFGGIFISFDTIDRSELRAVLEAAQEMQKTQQTNKALIVIDCSSREQQRELDAYFKQHVSYSNLNIEVTFNYDPKQARERYID